MMQPSVKTVAMRRSMVVKCVLAESELHQKASRKEDGAAIIRLWLAHSDRRETAIVTLF
jgi:hypothetical protein